MCLETIHWRFCGHHTTSWEFCHHSKLEPVLIRTPMGKQREVSQAPLTVQQLDAEEFRQNLEKLDLAYPPSLSPSASSTAPSSSPSLLVSPASPPTSPTSPPRTPSPPTSPPLCFSPPSPPHQPRRDHTQFFESVNIQRVYRRQPCTRYIDCGDDFSKFRASCTEPGGCDYERVGRQWSCCVCGRGPNRTMTCHRTFEARPLGNGNGEEEVCGHRLCPNCQPHVLPRVPVFNPDIMDWA